MFQHNTFTYIYHFFHSKNIYNHHNCYSHHFYYYPLTCKQPLCCCPLLDQTRAVASFSGPQDPPLTKLFMALAHLILPSIFMDLPSFAMFSKDSLASMQETKLDWLHLWMRNLLRSFAIMFLF